MESHARSPNDSVAASLRCGRQFSAESCARLTARLDTVRLFKCFKRSLKELDRVRLSVCVSTDISSFAKARIPRRRWEPSDRKPSTPHSQFDRWSGAYCSMRWCAHSNEKSGQVGIRAACCGPVQGRNVSEKGSWRGCTNRAKTKSVGVRTNFAGRHVRTVQCGKMSPVAMMKWIINYGGPITVPPRRGRDVAGGINTPETY